MLARRPDSRSVAIVLGSGHVGSAVALALQAAELAVVLVDEADPAWPRRGMAFTDAWYFGTAELGGEGACFCASVKSIPSVLRKGMIAATTWSWPGVAAAFAPAVLVDTRGLRRRGSSPLLGRVPLTVGIGPDFIAGENVDVAIAMPTADLRDSGPASHGLEAGALARGLRESPPVVEAVHSGRFTTARRIGDSVHAGQIVGGLGNEVVAAPATGVLLGLAARGARIEAGDTLVEVDPGGVAHRCFGVAEGPRRIAEGVVAEVAAHRSAGQGSGARDHVGRLFTTVA